MEGQKWGSGILRRSVHYQMSRVVLLATEKQEAEVCTLCHYISFEDVAGSILKPSSVQTRRLTSLLRGAHSYYILLMIHCPIVFLQR